MKGILGTSSREEDIDWLSVSDLMAGLMVIFLFIAIVFIRPIAEQNIVLEEQTELLEEQKALLQQQQGRITEIAVAWQETETSIYEALVTEFQNDLPRWNAEIERETLLVRFRAPEVLFAEGQSVLRARFQEILSDFFPRYVGVLSGFQQAIDEIRIEGHTSSDWNGASPAQAYYSNMELSQARTREVLSFVLSLPELSEDRPWVRSLLTANGLSSSRLIADEFGVEDAERSRRVEFRVRTTARSEIVRIIEEVR
ncbi:OmpA/MotB family protein [Pseudooceanicola atlanticus]|uniref:OmpA/MotB family protein n=1 Tax=Pseudooceanicola atlanticus TaxID=1461694 RepID=UPI0023571EC7|nr:OmpA family protein [Pseudooceanicola atlanticus]